MTANVTAMPKSTRASELEALLAFAEENGYEGGMEKLYPVLAQWKRPRSKSGEPSKAAQANAAYARRVYGEMVPEQPVFARQVMEMCGAGVTTPNKVAVIMKPLVERGLVVKGKHGKLTTYTRV